MNKPIKNLEEWLAQHGVIHMLIIVILFLLCFAEIRAIANQWDHNPGMQSPVNYYRGRIVHVPTSPTVADIQSWMTFSYIDFIFKLPPNYLQNALHLSDPHYPNVQIRLYSKVNNLNPATVIQQIQQAITAYTQTSKS